MGELWVSIVSIFRTILELLCDALYYGLDPIHHKN